MHTLASCGNVLCTKGYLLRLYETLRDVTKCPWLHWGISPGCCIISNCGRKPNPLNDTETYRERDGNPIVGINVGIFCKPQICCSFNLLFYVLTTLCLWLSVGWLVGLGTWLGFWKKIVFWHWMPVFGNANTAWDVSSSFYSHPVLSDVNSWK